MQWEVFCMNPKMPDFDTLVKIAQHDPDQLETIRHRLAASTISSAPKPLQQRLRGLQFQIDSTRHTSKTPLAACIRISAMMHESFSELRSALNNPSEKNHINDGNNVPADILPFPNN